MKRVAHCQACRALSMAALIWAFGCTTDPSMRPVNIAGPAAAYVALADRAAQKALDKYWNTTPDAVRYNRTLSVQDYERSAMVTCVEEGYRYWGHHDYKPAMLVRYRLKDPLPIFDFPNDMSFWADLASNQVD